MSLEANGKMIVVGQITHTHTHTVCLHPDPCILWVYYVTWQKGIKFTDGIKLADQMALDGRLSWIIGVSPNHRQGRGRQKAGNQGAAGEGLCPAWLATKMEKGAIHQGMLGKTRNRILPKSLQKECSLKDTLILALDFELLTPPGMSDNKLMLFYTTRFVVSCYSSTRN